MRQLKYNRELYSKIALIKAAYNFTDRAYVHLDADEKYYYVSLNAKNEKEEISDDSSSFLGATTLVATALASINSRIFFVCK